VVKCEKAWVKILGKSAVIATERGAKAVVPLAKLCEYAKRLDLCIENYDCSGFVSQTKGLGSSA